jgi:predicted O-methyltransferase YrrM
MNPSPQSAEQTLALILADRPPVHPKRDGSSRCIGLHSGALQYLYSQLSSDYYTLETGCGLSTLIFALAGCHHQSIVPNQAHIEATRQQAEHYQIDFSQTSFIAARSETILPQLTDPPGLNVVLVDGGHAFPIPFIDWFYAGRRVAVGGLLVVDDIGLKTVSVLYDFLNKQPQWQKEKVLHKTAFFRKQAELEVDDAWDYWHEQPFNYHWRARLRHLYLLLRQQFRGY